MVDKDSVYKSPSISRGGWRAFLLGRPVVVRFHFGVFTSVYVHRSVPWHAREPTPTGARKVLPGLVRLRVRVSTPRFWCWGISAIETMLAVQTYVTRRKRELNHQLPAGRKDVGGGAEDVGGTDVGDGRTPISKPSRSR